MLSAISPPSLALDQLRLVLAALQASPGHQLDLAPGRRARRAASHGSPPRARGRPSAPARQLDADRQRRLLLDPGRRAAGPGCGRSPAGAKPPTTSRTADGKTLTPRTISMSSVRPMQRTRGPVRPQGHGLVRTSTWSRVRNRSSGAARWRRWVSTSSPAAPSLDLHRRAAGRIDQLRRARTRARRDACPSCALALAPERDADVPDPHRLGDPRAPARLEPGAERRLASAGLARPRARARRSSPPGRSRARAAHSMRYAAYDGVSTAASGPQLARSRARAARCCRCRPGCGTSPMRSNAASAAPATNGPAL